VGVGVMVGCWLGLGDGEPVGEEVTVGVSVTGKIAGDGDGSTTGRSALPWLAWHATTSQAPISMATQTSCLVLYASGNINFLSELPGRERAATVGVGLHLYSHSPNLVFSHRDS